MDWTANYNALMTAKCAEPSLIPEELLMSKKQSMAIDYSGQQAPAPWLWQWLVHGSGKQPYRVSVRHGAPQPATDYSVKKETAVWGCTCPASRFMQDGERTCKHVLRLHVEMLQNPMSFSNVPERVRNLLATASPQGLTGPLSSGTLPSQKWAAAGARRIKVIQ